MSDLTREGWRRLLEQLDEPAVGQVAEALADARDLAIGAAYDRVEEAIDAGDLLEDTEVGAFGVVRVPEESKTAESGEESVEEPVSDGATPTPEAVETGERDGENDPMTVAEPLDEKEYPESIRERGYWVSWILDGEKRKRPVAPWQTGHAYPVKWRGDLEDDERPETDFHQAKKWVDFPLDHAGLALPDDARSEELRLGIIIPVDRPPREERVALIDWDDVRDPETGEIHPVAGEYIDRYGGFVEVSRSGEGLHQFVFGGLPGRRNKLIAPIDDEPFIGDDKPCVEVYDGGRHVAMTGDRVPGTDADLVDGQECIAELVERFGEAEIEAGYRSSRTPSAPAEDGEVSDAVEIDVDPAEEAPEEMPTCYGNALAARLNPDETGYGTNHDLNLHVAILGVYAGYDNDELIEQFRQYPLHNNSDKFDDGITREAIKGTRRKVDDGTLAPPSEKTLLEKGLLDETGCDCPIHTREDEAEEHKRDPREVDVVLEPRRAWEAAGRVTPDQLDEPIGLEVTADGEAWRCPTTGARVDDVARAVAIADEVVEDAEKPLGEEYATCYGRARDRHQAPLPEYLTHADTVARFDHVLGAIRELDFFHLDRDALTVEITGEGLEVAGEATLTLDPTPVDGWRDSESGKSVLVFPSGTIYDVDLGDDGQVIDALRFVAVDAGVIDDPTGALEGEKFTEAYRVAREEYGAPLPRWNAGAPDVTPVLPHADDLVEAPEVEEDELTEIRDEVEELYRGLANGDGAADVNVLQVLPALGKTTSAVKTAADTPTTYLAPRKELMAQAEEKARKWGATSAHLPIFSEANLAQEALLEAVAFVRERGTDTLADREALLEAVDGEIWDDEDDQEGDDVEIDRPTCPTAEGDHGDAWALAVHVARELDYTPRDIHQRARALFGEPLPCQHTDCEYSDGWDLVADPDAPIDLLIGHYVHGHVESARTYYTRDADGITQREPRAIVLDEFPGTVFSAEFGDEAAEHVVWLARALHEDVEDRHDLATVDLWKDEFVRMWLDGDEDDHVAELDQALEAEEYAFAAAEAARELLEYDIPEEYGLEEVLRRVVDVPADYDARATLADQILSVDASERDGAFWMVQKAEEDVAKPLAKSADGNDEDLLTLARDALPEGELVDVVESAATAAAEGKRWAESAISAARDAIVGGDDGARELAVFSSDGYAHRDANYLLEAFLRPGEDGAERISTSSYFAADGDGSNVKRVTVDGVTVIYDRNDRGAEIHNPPEWVAGDGEACPVIGLDATARSRLWEVALGHGVDVELRDVHESRAERARCLREVHKLQIVQTSELMKTYEGDPDGKNLDADVALLEEIADKYAGVHAARDRDQEDVQVGKPAAITTKVVRDVLEDDDRLDDVVSEWENYGNLTGDNTLGDHQLAALLGCQHYGDQAVERFAALGGEEIETDRSRTGYGHELDYQSEVANEYLGLMREDQVMQAALRFTRGGSGALVFAHTAALRDDLPVVGEGEVIRSWSSTASAIAEEWRRHPDGEFTVADVADAVDVSRRQVRRVLAEFVDAGYLERHETGDGLANEFTPVDQPGAGEADVGAAELDTTTAEVGREDLDIHYTANVRVRGVNSPTLPSARARGSRLPAPDTSDPGGPRSELET